MAEKNGIDEIAVLNMKQGCSGTKYATEHLEPGYQSPPTGTKNDCPAQAWITYCSLRLDQIETGVCGKYVSSNQNLVTLEKDCCILPLIEMLYLQDKHGFFSSILISQK